MLIGFWFCFFDSILSNFIMKNSSLQLLTSWFHSLETLKYFDCLTFFLLFLHNTLMLTFLDLSVLEIIC